MITRATLFRRLLICLVVVLVALSGTLGARGASAGAATAPVATTFTATLSGTQITATLTAADGSVPAGLPVLFFFQPAGAGASSVSGSVTDANGQVSVSEGYPDFGTTYWYSWPGDSNYDASTSNSVHVSAPVATRLFVSSGLSGATVSGTVISTLHGFTKPGLTVQLYAGASAPTALVGSSVTNDAGRGSGSRPPLTTRTSIQGVIVSDQENTGSASNTGTVKVSTKTTMGLVTSGGRVTVHGAVTDGNGTARSGLHVRLVVGPPGTSNVRDLSAVTSDAHGHYSYTGSACTTACVYQAITQEDATYLSSWARTGTVKAPTRLALTAQRGRPDQLTITLTHAANNAPIANQKVTVYYHYAGRSSWVRQTVATTNRYGRASVPEQPRRGCYFTTRYYGASTVAPAASTNVYLAY